MRKERIPQSVMFLLRDGFRSLRPQTCRASFEYAEQFGGAIKHGRLPIKPLWAKVSVTFRCTMYESNESLCEERLTLRSLLGSYGFSEE